MPVWHEKFTEEEGSHPSVKEIKYFIAHMDSLIAIILSALASSALTYFFGIRHLRTEAEIKIKSEKYNNLIKYLKGFVGKSANKDLKEKFFQEWETSWLFCSDKVFNAIRQMAEHIRKLPEMQTETKEQNIEGKKILGDVILAMRNDLLHKKTKLTNDDFTFYEVLKD